MSDYNWQNPERVEPGQVWEMPEGLASGADGVIVVRRKLGDRIVETEGGLVFFIADGGGWRCVGYELDDGRRVMVGDRFRPANGCKGWVVSAVLCDARVELAKVEGVAVYCFAVQDLLDPKCGWAPVFGVVGARGSAPAPNAKLKIECVGASLAPADIAEVTGAVQDAQAAARGIDAERWHRDALRREVDKMLAEDTRRCPAFATARRAAVLADVEMPEDAKLPERGPRAIERLIRTLHDYEAARGGGRSPSAKAVDMMAIDTTLAVYERARGQR